MTFHPAARRPRQALGAALGLSLISAGLFLLTEPLTALVLILLLWGSLADYFLPCRYEFGAELRVRKGLVRQSFPWSRFRSVHLDRSGLLLSPFRGRHWLENFRGVFLPMEGETARRLLPELSARL